MKNIVQVTGNGQGKSNGSDKRSAEEKNRDRLTRRHLRLKERISEYETRLFLTSPEQLELVRWKKEKLATKDQLTQLSSIR